MALDRMRKPFFVLAAALFAAAMLVEAGSRFLRGAKPDPDAVKQIAIGQLKAEGLPADSETVDPIVAAIAARPKPPGLALSYLAWLDLIILYVVGSALAGLIVPAGIQGRVQSIVTLVVSIVGIIVSIVMILAAFQLLLIMVALLTSPPFGTAAYMAKWGFFNKGAARAILGASFALKIGFGVSLVAAHQRYLQHKGFIFLTIVSLIGNVVISLLHGWVPRVLVSITDAIAAIVVGILAVVVCIVLLVGGVIGVVKLAT